VREGIEQFGFFDALQSPFPFPLCVNRTQMFLDRQRMGGKDKDSFQLISSKPADLRQRYLLMKSLIAEAGQ